MKTILVLALCLVLLANIFCLETTVEPPGETMAAKRRDATTAEPAHATERRPSLVINTFFQVKRR